MRENEEFVVEEGGGPSNSKKTTKMIGNDVKSRIGQALCDTNANIGEACRNVYLTAIRAAADADEYLFVVEKITEHIRKTQDLFIEFTEEVTRLKVPERTNK